MENFYTWNYYLINFVLNYSKPHEHFIIFWLLLSTKSARWNSWKTRSPANVVNLINFRHCQEEKLTEQAFWYYFFDYFKSLVMLGYVGLISV